MLSVYFHFNLDCSLSFTLLDMSLMPMEDTTKRNVFLYCHSVTRRKGVFEVGVTIAKFILGP
jgi:hypothetical protein